MAESKHSHARRNPLTGEWVLVSPGRLQRPRQGEVDEPDMAVLPRHADDCYLCPGNSRAGGEVNPDYQGAWVFDNDFPALGTDSHVDAPAHPLFETRPETGCCRVICYTERHDLRLSTMGGEQLTQALEAMIGQFTELDAREDIAYVQVFENRGSMMGCSNPHPHAQVWATSGIPSEPQKELDRQTAWWREHGTVMLDEYLQAELADGSRVVTSNGGSAAVVPYWAVWPFETLVMPRRAVAAPDDLTAQEVSELAATLGAVLAAYDRLFSTAAPYSLGMHPRPSDGERHPEWHFHIHVYPPLLRSAAVRKHLVGFEMLAMPQRDLTPEAAAGKLRQSLPEISRGGEGPDV